MQRPMMAFDTSSQPGADALIALKYIPV